MITFSSLIFLALELVTPSLNNHLTAWNMFFFISCDIHGLTCGVWAVPTFDLVDRLMVVSKKKMTRKISKMVMMQ